MVRLRLNGRLTCALVEVDVGVGGGEDLADGLGRSREVNLAFAKALGGGLSPALGKGLGHSLHTKYTITALLLQHGNEK